MWDIWWKSGAETRVSANNSVLSLVIVNPLLLLAYSFINARRHIILAISSIIK
jgi:hypothetical protein